MKRLIILTLIGFLSNQIFSQDIIVKKNGAEINSKVIEITNEVIKYKEYDFQDGPQRNVKITDVELIIYANGRRESFATSSNATEDVALTIQQGDGYKANYFMLGLGRGISYGNTGFRAQFRVGGKIGFGMHIGAGTKLGPEGDNFGDMGPFPFPILFSYGYKLFIYKGLYIDTQISTDLNSVTNTYSNYDYYYNTYSSYEETYTELIFGPSVLIGGDFSWGRKVGIGFNPAIGVNYVINDDRFRPVFDLGLILRF